jgi:hypothetical protein
MPVKILPPFPPAPLSKTRTSSSWMKTAPSSGHPRLACGHPESDAHQDRHRNADCCACFPTPRCKWRSPCYNTATHESKNTDAEHLLEHYVTFEDVKHQKFDGLIITGAPIEQMPFEEVDYWKELNRSWIGRRRTSNPISTFAGERKPRCITNMEFQNMTCPARCSASLNIAS